MEALARAYAGRPESDAPHHREEAARRKQAEAVATLLAAVPAAKRPGVKLMLRVLRAQIRYLGMGKASFLMGIDGVRAAARRIGTELVADGVVADVDDAFYLTFDELLGPTPDNLEAAEILVCHFTDPSWAALFPLAEAVVIAVGTMASHGAVVSRELGIPCVIGTGDGTRRLRTGDRVRVDGIAGTVEVLGFG